METMNEFGGEPKENTDNSKPTLQRKYKDSVFTKAFSTKENLLDLYLTLHPEDSDVKAEEIESIALDNDMFTNMYNDVAFSVRGKIIVLVEHQSTANYNMPLRMLFYVADEYKRTIKDLNKNIYKTKLMKIPAPEFYVVYTGNDDFPENLHLSDALGCSDFIELNVKVIKEEDPRSMLGGYIMFIKIVEENRKTLGDVNAIMYAMKCLKGKSKFSSYLEPRESEVVEIMGLGWDYELEKEACKEEGRDNTIIQGASSLIKQNQSKDFIIQTLVTMFALSTEEALDYYEEALNRK